MEVGNELNKNLEEVQEKDKQAESVENLTENKRDLIENSTNLEEVKANESQNPIRKPKVIKGKRKVENKEEYKCDEQTHSDSHCPTKVTVFW
ncbi:unnamed protein product [Blepharisma stoltei]|uniref:Uncharacterized protein n=1 Tax=Blepharisma stoltei TaxID=1481888 RepID=A0AAU9JQN5_9CILI|nr:unnamed protein product [Blepharisma stoltei]